MFNSVEPAISEHAAAGDALLRLLGSLAGGSAGAGDSWIGQQVQNQSAYLSYVDVFWVLMLLSLAAVPLAMSLRKVKLGAAGARGALRPPLGSIGISAPASSSLSERRKPLAIRRIGGGKAEQRLGLGDRDPLVVGVELSRHRR